MSRKTKAEIMAGVECERSRIAGNNTVEYFQNGDRVIRLHLTDIITFKKNGDVVLNSGGWRTPTTKSRMNDFLPGWQVWQESKIWYVGKSWHGERFVFEDGMVLHSDGTVSGEGPDFTELKKLNREIQKYVKGYMKALFNGDVPAPSGGDCWGCLFFDQMEQPDSDHILQHFEEKYYVPTLLKHAIEEIPVSQAAMHVLGYCWDMHEQEAKYWTDIGERQLASSLKRYLQRRLGLAR